MSADEVKTVELITVYEVYTITSRGPFAWKNRTVHGNFYTKRQADHLANTSIGMSVGKYQAIILDGTVVPVFSSKKVSMTGTRHDVCASQCSLDLPFPKGEEPNE